MQSQRHALGAGAAAPENGDVLTAGTVQDVWDQESSNGTDSEGAAGAAQGLDAKQFATLQARAAIAGFELVRMADGSFVVARWTMTRAGRRRGDRGIPGPGGRPMIDWEGSRRQTCPSCGRGPKDRTCGVTVDERGGVAHCHRCNYVENRFDDEVRLRPGRPVPCAARIEKHEALSDYWHRVWNDCRPLSGDGRAYLEARCCVIPPADGDLRYHPSLKHTPSGTSGPALVALVTDVETRQPISMHRTWIRADGSKADLAPPRMLIPDHRKAGGVVRLWPDEAVTHGLGVAEGVESALSLAHAFQPVWALIDAGNLAAMPILPGIESLLIAADHDEAGIAAARSCASRWTSQGREVGVVMPGQRKSDINDLARAA